MLLPTQAAARTAIIDSLQSTLDTIEERRKQEDEKKTGRKKDPLLEARISASDEAKRAQGRIAEALFGVDKVDINELKIQLMDKLGEKLGIHREDDMSAYGYGRAIENALKSISPTDLNDLSKELGLNELDISLTQLVAAIKAPWGEENDRLEKALDRQHGDGKTTAEQRAKIVQRLEDVSDPKTVEELKLGPQYSDPTRVEDDETRAERLEDIKVKEAAEKLEDVENKQDAIRERLRQEKMPGDKAGNEPEASAVIDDVLLLSLNAEAQTDEKAKDASEDDQRATAEAIGPEPQTDGSTSSLQADDKTLEKLDAFEEALSVRLQVDEIGIYDILKLRHAATLG